MNLTFGSLLIVGILKFAIVATLRLAVGMLEQARGKLPRHLDIGRMGRKDFEDAILN
jgi:hypothetical protein